MFGKNLFNYFNTTLLKIEKKGTEVKETVENKPLYYIVLNSYKK